MTLKLKSLFLKLSSTVIVSALSINTAIACDINGNSGFLPENNRYIPVGLKSLGGINEAQFNKVLDKVEKLFTEAVTKNNVKFVIERRWTDGTVNALAHQKVAGVYTIVMYGGLARHTETTEDAMALVACHELGHHLGGAPKKTDENGVKRWASSEGQSDYWGTMKCLSKYFEADDNATIVKSMNVPATAIKECNTIYSNENDRAICVRSVNTGMSLARLLSDISGRGNDKPALNLSTPDKNIVKVSYEGHPDAQCRLDTYFQAALCDHGFSEEASTTDANIGVCTLRNGDKVGNRPTCWYLPE